MRNIFCAVCKIVGLLLVYTSFSSISTALFFVGAVHGMAPGGSIGGGFAFGMLVYAIVSLGLAWTLILKTEWVADKLRVSSESEAPFKVDAGIFPTCVRGIGVYLVVTAVPLLIQTCGNAGSLSLSYGFNPWLGINFLPALLKVIFACLLLFKTKYFIAIVEKGEKLEGAWIFAGGFVLVVLLLVMSKLLHTYALDEIEKRMDYRRHSIPSMDGSAHYSCSTNELSVSSRIEIPHKDDFMSRVSNSLPDTADAELIREMEE